MRPIRPTAGKTTPGSWADRPPDAEVFIEDGRAVTSSDLRLMAGKIAAELRRGKSVRCAVFSLRPSVLAASILASADAGCDLLILRKHDPDDDPGIRAAGADGLIGGDLAFRALGGPAAAAPPLPPSRREILIPTSGTSGVPKIARHSLSGLLGRARPGKAGSGAARWLLTYQPFGFAGLQMILTALLTDSVLIGSGEPDVGRLAREALAHRVTHISGTPTMWRSLLMCLGSSAGELPLAQATLGGEVVDQAILDKIHSVFPKAGISHIYASTEAGSLFSVKDGRSGFPAAWLEKPVAGVRLRVRDGLLEALSPRRMLGYLGESPPPVAADGWIGTGDRVVLRGDRVHFLGRADSVINVGGAKAAPEEIEAALLDVANVLDLRAYAVPNPVTGFLVGLDVLAAPGGDEERIRSEIAAAAAAKLEPWKRPRVVRFVGAIPSDPSGKKSRKP